MYIQIIMVQLTTIMIYLHKIQEEGHTLGFSTYVRTFW